MGRRGFSSFVLASALAAGASFVLSSAVWAVGVNDYQLARTFTLPTANAASGGNVLFDALPDGRLLALNGTTVLRETAVDSGTFTPLGTIANFSPSFGPSFLTVSPDGTRAAVGTNGGGTVAVFNTNSPATSTNYAADDYDATWIDNNRLAISNTGKVQVLNTATNTLRTVVSNVGGASAGIAFDAAGNLYTGNGFDTVAGGTGTGYIKAFSKASWEAAAGGGGAAADFETGGVAVADLLSAGSLGFDKSGNFYVGGADFFGGSNDFGFAAVVDAAAIQAAFASGATMPVITGASPSSVLRKIASPADAIANQQPPAFAYNEATGELYLRYAFGDGTVSVYSVPEPNAMAGLILAGLAGLRRRRRQVAGTAVAVVATAGASAASAAYVYDPLSFATQVISSTAQPATGLYNDPAAILGRPTLTFNNGNAAAPDVRRAKLIEAPYNTGPAGEKLITTFNAGQSVTVKMGRPVTDDPTHPFGIDLNVFGNAFFTGSGGIVSDATNLNTFTLGGGLLAEGVRVSVSPDNVNWYSYANGPTGDGFFPTNSYRWDRASATWSNDELDPTRPVNPALANSASFAGLTGADALDLYAGAAGGAGFDLAPSGFAAISYVRFDGLTGYSGGEIDAVAAVPEPGVMIIAGVVAGLLRRRPL